MVAVLTPKVGGKPIVIDKAVILVGRHPDCDYVLQASRKVSRRHVCIVQVNDRYMVRDLGSMNGIWVNETRVEREHPIGIGDELSIGDQIFRFEEVQRMPRKPKAQSAPPAAKPAQPPQKVVTPIDDNDYSRNYPVPVPDEVDDESFVVIDDNLSAPEPPGTDDEDIIDVGDVKLVDDVEIIEDVEVLDDVEEVDLLGDVDGALPGNDSLDEFVPVENVDVIDEDIDDVVLIDDPEVLDDDDIIVLD